MVQPSTPASRLRQFLNEDAARLGFDSVGIALAREDSQAVSGLDEFIAEDRFGTMQWMPETRDRRRSVTALWPEARSVIMLGMNYGPDADPLENLAHKDVASISVYARHRDYHDIIKGRLKELAGRLLARSREVFPGQSHEVKVFVDTAPLMEKPLAQAAGLGWQGKHTNLVSRDFGSWLFLGSIVTTLDLKPDAPVRDSCGTCRACQDICPTNAFPEPYKLDARRCISYLTIETRKPVPQEMRTLMGNRIYGCDDCLAVCPWNKFASNAGEARLIARDDLKSPKLMTLLALNDRQFREMFSGSPVKRVGRAKFVSNCLIAAGNSGQAVFLPVVQRLLLDEAELVRAMAVWAMSQLSPALALESRSTALVNEESPLVRSEWNALVEKTG
ncbi:tRNA epoxyqueuosine(34) reductase QueG [Aureimonas fodinaquatilis]|uniref:tRNA epoxyqueuosine(34) reductase QueG n=1 Tax=Aureimonas fodinaquatilis TaxID=2565783 RepID=A0A5B0DNZ1_9HYPH|nr:tRNA epoxyqueuosine(34) reductase QueG [Aureimonas fodinaquatilis]KAA0968123.1 tRNA epoxyqueuosine(34) reductase QueG [Aureimonas fodinaquatilis]